MKTFEFQIKFHWHVFLRVWLMINHHWFRWWVFAEQGTSHYLNQWWHSLLTHMCNLASMGELEDVAAVFFYFLKIGFWTHDAEKYLRHSLWNCSHDNAREASPMRTQHWFRQWLGAIRQQAITWANVDTDLCCHIASLGHNECETNHVWNWIMSLD